MKIIIDTEKWKIPSEASRLIGISPQALSNRIKRGTVETWEIQELKIKLINIKNLKA